VVSRPPSTSDIPEELRRMIGTTLEEISVLPDFSSSVSTMDCRVVQIDETAAKAAVFAAKESNRGALIRVKLFHREAIQDADYDAVLSKIIRYQSNMDDPNVLKLIGTAALAGKKVLLYEHMPVNMETVLLEHPDGLSVDVMLCLVPQVLNGLGYSHIHRGKDGIVRRLGHLNIKPSKVLLDSEMKVVKIDDCGVSKSIIEVRGPSRYLWEEPGADPGALPPEAFVMQSKFLNPFNVDIYALGVLLYMMATGKVPFVGADIEEHKFAHLKKYPVPPRVHRYDLPLWLDEMILKCLEKEPEKRWRSATQMELARQKWVGR
jgi:serine/threonine-protein kinase